MKLTDIADNKDEKKGTYAGVKFSDATVERLVQYCKDNKIPNALKPEKFHTTLLYSRKHLPNYDAEGKYQSPMMGLPDEFNIWESQPDDDNKKSNCLVMIYNCSPLYQRHHKLMLTHGASYDFDQYVPHVTLSYDVGNLKVDDLPEFNGELEITDEYKEDLTLSWASDDEKKK